MPLMSLREGCQSVWYGTVPTVSPSPPKSACYPDKKETVAQPRYSCQEKQWKPGLAPPLPGASQLPGIPNTSLIGLNGILMTPLNSLILIQLLWSPSGSHCPLWSRLLTVCGLGANLSRQHQSPSYPGKPVFPLLFPSLWLVVPGG